MVEAKVKLIQLFIYLSVFTHFIIIIGNVILVWVCLSKCLLESNFKQITGSCLPCAWFIRALAMLPRSPFQYFKLNPSLNLTVATYTIGPYVGNCVKNGLLCPDAGIEPFVLAQLLDPLDIGIEFSIVNSPLDSLKAVAEGRADVSLPTSTFGSMQPNLTYFLNRGILLPSYEERPCFLLKKQNTKFASHMMSQVFGMSIWMSLLASVGIVWLSGLAKKQLMRYPSSYGKALGKITIGLGLTTVLGIYTNLLAIALFRKPHITPSINSFHDVREALKSGRCHLTTSVSVKEQFSAILFPTYPRNYLEHELTDIYMKNPPVIYPDHDREKMWQLIWGDDCWIGIEFETGEGFFTSDHCDITVVKDNSVSGVKYHFYFGNHLNASLLSAITTSAMQGSLSDLFWKIAVQQADWNRHRRYPCQPPAQDGQPGLTVLQLVDAFQYLAFSLAGCVLIVVFEVVNRYWHSSSRRYMLDGGR